jgi:hypothetical protein
MAGFFFAPAPSGTYEKNTHRIAQVSPCFEPKDGQKAKILV